MSTFRRSSFSVSLTSRYGKVRGQYSEVEKEINIVIYRFFGFFTGRVEDSENKQMEQEKRVKICTGAEEILNALPTSKKFDLPIIRILEDGKQMNKKLTLTICAGKERPLTLLMPDGEITLDGESCSEKLWQWW